MRRPSTLSRSRVADYPMSTPTPPQVWLFWDGACGLCRRIVAWVERRDRAGRIRAVPYQTAPRPPMTDELAQRCRTAVHVLMPDGGTLSAGRACLYVLERLGWTTVARVGRLPPLIWAVELGYWLVARNRGWLGSVLPWRVGRRS